MKSRNLNLTQQLITVYADDKKGLLGQLLMFFNRRDYPVRSLNVARTDIEDQVIICLETAIPVLEVNTIMRKLGNIIEVYRVTAVATHEALLRKVGLYKLAGSGMNSERWALLQRYGAIVSEMDKNEVVVYKIGSEKDIQDLYNQLDDTHLLAYCQTNMPNAASLATFNF